MESQQAQSQQTPVIKDLIIINNDRYEGYKNAAENTKDADLKAMFNDFSTQSRGFAEELKRFVTGDLPQRDETKNTGKLYRVWMDVKAAVTGKDRKAILSSCEFGEDVAVKHYEEALSKQEGISAEAKDTISRQHSAIMKSHDRVKALRDSAK